MLAGCWDLRIVVETSRLPRYQEFLLESVSTVYVMPRLGADVVIPKLIRLMCKERMKVRLCMLW
jgi:hypothetical protein